MANARLSDDGRTLVVRVPTAFATRGGRKLIVLPDGASAVPTSRPRVDNTMVKALARAHRWQRRLESGEYGSVTEIATSEKINRSYVCRILRLTLLAPDIVEAILDGRQPATVSLAGLMKPLPVEWQRQRHLHEFGG